MISLPFDFLGSNAGSYTANQFRFRASSGKGDGGHEGSSRAVECGEDEVANIEGAVGVGRARCKPSNTRFSLFETFPTRFSTPGKELSTLRLLSKLELAEAAGETK